MKVVLTDLALGRTISEYKYSNKTNWFAETAVTYNRNDIVVVVTVVQTGQPSA